MNHIIKNVYTINKFDVECVLFGENYFVCITVGEHVYTFQFTADEFRKVQEKIATPEREQ